MEKRYTRQQAERLLTRVIAAVNVPPGRGTKRILAELLQARLEEVVLVGDPMGDIDRADGDRVARWHRVLGTLVRQTVNVRDRLPGIQPQLVFRNVSITVSPIGEFRIEVHATGSQALLLQGISLLRATGARVRACECGRLFVREGKRTYCSESCQKRFYMRRFRAGAAGKE